MVFNAELNVAHQKSGGRVDRSHMRVQVSRLETQGHGIITLTELEAPRVRASMAPSLDSKLIPASSTCRISTRAPIG